MREGRVPLPIPMETTDLDVAGYQKVVRAIDAESGLHAFIAVHDTTLGPAIGGMRMWPYASEEETKTRFIQIELLYKEQKVDNLERRIFELKVERAKYKKRGEPWPMLMEGELQRLERLKRSEDRKIDKLLERGEK